MPDRQILIFCFILFFLFSCGVKRTVPLVSNKNVFEIFLEDPAIRSAQCGFIFKEVGKKIPLATEREHSFFTPASNTKIVTTYLMLESGWDSTLTARYVLTSENVICIRPMGDPTFLHRDFPDHPMYDLLSKFDTIFIEKDTNFLKYGKGWAWDDYDRYFMPEMSFFPVYGNTVLIQKTDSVLSTDPTLFVDSLQEIDLPFRRHYAQNIFNVGQISKFPAIIPFVTQDSLLSDLLRDTLPNHPHIYFVKTCPVDTGMVVKGKPIDSVLLYFMVNSDNFIGEQLVYTLAKNGGGARDPGMFINTSLDSLFQDSVMSYRFFDASGLSRYNQVTPSRMVSLLEQQWQKIGHQKIKSIYSKGEKGQLPDEFIPLGDVILAKTGSMRNVFALSGYLKCSSGNWLVFSVMINGHMSTQKSVRKAVSSLLEMVRQQN